MHVELRLVHLEKVPVGGAILRAFATVLLNDGTRMRGVQVIDSPRGRFVAVPRRKQPVDSWGYLDEATTAAIRQAVLDAYAQRESEIG